MADAPMQRSEAAEGFHLDCYPYTFSPLLLFASEGYFDKVRRTFPSPPLSPPPPPASPLTRNTSDTLHGASKNHVLDLLVRRLPIGHSPWQTSLHRMTPQPCPITCPRSPHPPWVPAA